MANDTPTGLRGDEAALYREHHTALRRAVARRVRLDEDLIEDACQTAWMQLLRCQPDRERPLFGWLVTVAVHEAYDLSRRRRGELSLDTVVAAGGDRTIRLVDTVEGPTVVDESLEARRALRALASLPRRQRRYAVLRTAGFSYREIGQLTGATHTNVNKHLVRASRQLKSLADQAA
jgi:RNA polymerase sigma factor (sigma-70 family)